MNSSSATDTADAVVIGSGHHGLVAAATLADAGWDVHVLEAQPEPGGAVKSAELTPGYITDLYSAFYPMTVASPAIDDLHLEDHGLRWTHAPAVVGHPRSADDVDAPLLYRDIDRTASELDRRDPGDGNRWRSMCEQWRRTKNPLLATLFAPFPPARGPLQLLRRLGAGGALDLARQLLLPANEMAQQLFTGEAARVLLLGNAMHADIPVDAPGSGLMGYLLTMLAQDVGYPVPVGGAGQLTAALVARGRSAGARIECNQEVVAIDVRRGRAVAVHTRGGSTIRVRRAVVADTTAQHLYQRLLPADAVPGALLRKLDDFVWDPPVVKVNYALDAPMPWRSPALGGAGTVHLGADRHGLIRWMADLHTGTVPDYPFLLFGQMTTADPSRSPAGTESAWGYSHLPHGVFDDASADKLADAIDRVLEDHAPGFSDHVVYRSVQRPCDLQAADANLHTGAINGGTSQLFQQLIFRPVPGFGRPQTPVQNVFLGSAAISPGGSVHGTCGRNAANAALASDGIRGWPRRRIQRTVLPLISG